MKVYLPVAFDLEVDPDKLQDLQIDLGAAAQRHTRLLRSSRQRIQDDACPSVQGGQKRVLGRAPTSRTTGPRP